MSQLIYLRENIDAGWTAKLVITGLHVTVTIRIKHMQHEDMPCYGWQHVVEGNRAYPEIPPVHTELHPNWGQLLDAIDGTQTASIDWTLCRDALVDYLPPERMTAPVPQ